MDDVSIPSRGSRHACDLVDARRPGPADRRIRRFGSARSRWDGDRRLLLELPRVRGAASVRRPVDLDHFEFKPLRPHNDISPDSGSRIRHFRQLAGDEHISEAAKSSSGQLSGQSPEPAYEVPLPQLPRRSLPGEVWVSEPKHIPANLSFCCITHCSPAEEARACHQFNHFVFAHLSENLRRTSSRRSWNSRFSTNKLSACMKGIGRAARYAASDCQWNGDTMR